MKKKTWARKNINKNLIQMVALLITLTIICALIGLYINWIFGARYIFFVCGGIVFGVVLYSVLEKILYQKFVPRLNKYKGLVQGEIGEATVNESLKQNLDKGNVIIADAMLEEDRGNIDHIVIGKYGIFVIETKTNRGRIICDGDDWFQDKIIGGKYQQMKMRYSPSKQAKSNAFRLHSFLKQNYQKLSKEWINAVVIFPNKEDEGIPIFKKNIPVDCKVFDSIDEMLLDIKKGKISNELKPDDLLKLENIFIERSANVTSKL